MTRRRPTALAALLYVTIGCGVASAQTVVVRNAPPKTTIEFVLNDSVVATATAGANGLATLTAAKGLGDRDMVDVFVWVDDCGTTRRIVVMNRTQQPAPGDGCRRNQVAGLFLLQRITSLLVDIETSSPTLRLRQGPLPEEWLKPPSTTAASAPRISIAPRGMIVFAGGENGNFGRVLEPACGDVVSCSTPGRAFSFAGGLSYWFTQFVGAEASYVRPSQLSTNATGDRFRFDSDIDGGLMVFVAKGGVPIGRVRVFGSGGANYHRATFTTHETIDDLTATVGGTSQTTPGGSTTLQWRTEGWGPAFGGGTEVWLTSSIGIYGEVTRLAVKGTDTGAGEAKTDKAITALIVGGRYRFARR